jgi:folate-binding protein YgfZ
MQSGIQNIWTDAAVLSFAGTDTETFLQGYITSDTCRSNSDEFLPTSITDIKGRVLASGWSLKQPEGIDLIVHQSIAKKIESFLHPYLQFSKSVLSCEKKIVCHSDKGIPLFNQQPIEIKEKKLFHESSMKKDDELKELLTKHHFTFIEEKISGQFLPQQLGLHTSGAVDFDKGCYLGQEIVARVQFRGSVKKTLSAVELSPGQYSVGDRLEDRSTLVQISKSGQGLVVGSAD